MLTFEKIKWFYDSKLWTKAMVKRAVAKGVLTQAQYEEIVGDNDTDNGTNNPHI